MCRYGEEARPRIKAEDPALTFGEIAKEMGAQWMALSAAEKDAWKQQ